MNHEEILAAFRDVAEAKGWGALHTPRNLALALSVETAELLSLFQWQLGDRNAEIEADPAWRQQAGEELADVLMYWLALCESLNLDPEQIVADKIALNRKRFLENDHG